LLAPIAFQRLDAKLQELQHGMFEMEILPAELCGNDDISVRTDGDFLAMPKRGLQLAFSHASRILNLSGGATTSNTASDDSSLRLRATAVILFQSPEHLTACNIRKRNLVELMRRHEDNVNAEVDSRTSSELLLGALFYELTLTKSLLSSQLPRHAKSPTLWTHRRWLFTTFLELITFLRRNISDDAVDEEPDEGFVDDEEPDEEFVDDEDTEDNVIRDDTILTEEQAIALGIDVQNVKVRAAHELASIIAKNIISMISPYFITLPWRDARSLQPSTSLNTTMFIWQASLTQITIQPGTIYAASIECSHTTWYMFLSTPFLVHLHSHQDVTYSPRSSEIVFQTLPIYHVCLSCSTFSHITPPNKKGRTPLASS
jgi:hypothetical protein